MPRPRRAIRRRLPKQERSRRLVEAIHEAARRVLVEGGPEALTTVNVAARAGVSVGSLYQYFAGREALLFAVFEDELARFGAAWSAWREESRGAPADERLRQGLALVLEHYRRLAALDPAFYLAHKAELLRAPEPGPSDPLARTREELARVRPGAFERVEATAFLLARGIPAVLEAALAHDPALLTHADFAQELHTLVAGYLLPRAS